MNRSAPGGDEEVDDEVVDSPPESVDEEALLAELAQLHTDFDNEKITFDDFEARREELLSKLRVD
jgi:hypothetical protein